MEAYDFLCCHVHISRPVLVIIVIFAVLVAECTDIVCKSVNPYVNYVTFVKVNRYAPGEGSTGYAKILKSCVDEVVDHLVYTGSGLEIIRFCKELADLVFKRESFKK